MNKAVLTTSRSALGVSSTFPARNKQAVAITCRYSRIKSRRLIGNALQSAHFPVVYESGLQRTYGRTLLLLQLLTEG